MYISKKGSPAWFIEAEPHLLKGVRTPKWWDWETDIPMYKMEVVRGCPLCWIHSPAFLHLLVRQVEAFSQVRVKSCTWHEYLNGLKHRTKYHEVLDWCREIHVPDSTLCHGDLTLENVMADRDAKTIVLIDPNQREFSSHYLDYGKLLFSAMGYHQTFHSQYINPLMAQSIKYKLAHDKAALACMLTHIIRLEGYRDQKTIDRWLLSVYGRVTSGTLVG